MRAWGRGLVVEALPRTLPPVPRAGDTIPSECLPLICEALIELLGGGDLSNIIKTWVCELGPQSIKYFQLDLSRDLRCAQV